jgi:hypothetical protein
MKPKRQHGGAGWRWLLGLTALVGTVSLGLWHSEAAAPLNEPDPAALLAAAPTAAGVSPASPASAVRPGPPLSELGQQQRLAAQARWQANLAQAREALAAYEAHARYPHQSRPAAEHPDQLYPFVPIAEEHPLRTPGGTAMQGVKLLTTQERVFASGPESNTVTLSLQDAQGRALPLRFTHAVIKEVTPPGRTAQTPERPLWPQDEGQDGDVQARDGVYTAVMRPSLQGFGNFAGRVRLELWMSHGGQPGFIYFDLVYDPGLAARWLPGVQESVAQGALALDLRLDVVQAGRYVINGRIDDANGQPFALALFNEELPAGPQTVRLWVHGRLLHDKKPAFPLVLRDVDGFLLRPDTNPDRVTLPRLSGTVHRTQTHALARFSPDAWPSEQRERYLAELGKDVDDAADQLKRLGP